MPRIADEVIERIRANTDIVEIIKEYIPLTKRGKNFFLIPAKSRIFEELIQNLLYK